jgi:hypothetical protein
MEHKNNDFPQYRKMKNGKAFYRIVNNLYFTEVQLLGEKRLRHEVEAKQYPEKLRIMDMLSCAEPFEVSTPDEFNAQLNFTL